MSSILELLYSNKILDSHGSLGNRVLKRILIIQTAFIGDVILASSLLETLHCNLPEIQIDLLVRKGNETLFRDHPFVKNILIWDKKGKKYKSLIFILNQVRRNRYDYVINLQRHGTTGLLTALSKARVTIGFDKNPLSFLFSQRYPHKFEAGVHETDRNHQLISSITDASKQKPKLYPSQEDYLRIAEYQKSPYYCIAPTSVWFTKQFPPSQWAKLIKQLPENSVIYLLGTPGDTELADQLSKLTGSKNTVNLCGKLSLLESAALMKGSVLNYVNDSAPMHLCSAMDAPVCAVYCSTVPEFGYGPLSSTSYIVQIETKLPCRPCGIHGHRSCPEGHFACALEIDTTRMASLG